MNIGGCSALMCKSLMYFTFLICELATILRVDYGFLVLLKLLFYADKPRINVVGLHIGLSDLYRLKDYFLSSEDLFSAAVLARDCDAWWCFTLT